MLSNNSNNHKKYGISLLYISILLKSFTTMVQQKELTQVNSFSFSESMLFLRYLKDKTLIIQSFSKIRNEIKRNHIYNT